MTNWRADLFANCNRVGLKGAIIGWFTCPGFAVAVLYRLMRWGRVRGGALGTLVAVLADRRAIKGYACHLSGRAIIGPGLRLPHPVGIVLGAGTVIGKDVTIYQHVTLGRRTADAVANPRVGDRAVLYAGAVVVGEADIGDDAIVGANAVVRHKVPAGGMATLGPMRISAAP